MKEMKEFLSLRLAIVSAGYTTMHKALVFLYVHNSTLHRVIYNPWPRLLKICDHDLDQFFPDRELIAIKFLADRFLHLQLYVLHHLIEEASGANTWMQNQHNFWYRALDKGITKSPKYSQELFCSKKSEDFENH